MFFCYTESNTSWIYSENCSGNCLGNFQPLKFRLRPERLSVHITHKLHHGWILHAEISASSCINTLFLTFTQHRLRYSFFSIIPCLQVCSLSYHTHPLEKQIFKGFGEGLRPKQKFFFVLLENLMCCPIATGTEGETWSHRESNQVCLLEHIFLLNSAWMNCSWEQLFGLLRKGQLIEILFKVLSNATLLPITCFSCCSKFLALCFCKQLIQSFINALLNRVHCKYPFSNRKRRKYERTLLRFIMAF